LTAKKIARLGVGRYLDGGDLGRGLYRSKVLVSIKFPPIVSGTTSIYPAIDRVASMVLQS